MNRVFHLSSLACLVVVVAACDRQAPVRDEQATVPRVQVPVTAREDGAAAWRLSADSAGPVPLGLPLRDLADRFTIVGDTAGGGAGCTYVRLADAPQTVLFMISEGRVARADVHDRAMLTSEGAVVGANVAHIRALYPNVIARPHKYLDEGDYLIVMPHAPADTMRWILFETLGDTVTGMRAGLLPEIRWVEGCS